MSNVIRYFKQSHLRILLLLIVLDLIATLNWYFFFGMEEANPLVVAGLWIGALLILYMAAKGLDQLNRAKVRPREYKCAE